MSSAQVPSCCAKLLCLFHFSFTLFLLTLPQFVHINRRCFATWVWGRRTRERRRPLTNPRKPIWPAVDPASGCTLPTANCNRHYLGNCLLNCAYSSTRLCLGIPLDRCTSCFTMMGLVVWVVSAAKIWNAHTQCGGINALESINRATA